MYRAIVADDEYNILEGMTEQIEAYDLDIKVVATAQNGQEVIEVCKTYSPDIIVIDINMPSLNGLEAIKEIRKTNAICSIVIVSGYDNFEYAQEAIRQNVDYYLLKPVDDNELYDILKSCLNKLDQKIYTQNIVNKFSPKEPNSSTDIISYIHQNYGNPNLSSEVIEKQFGISRTTLFKIMKSVTDKSLIEYITMIRMRQAIRLLKSSSSITIKEVATQVGYSDPYYFSRAFKKHTSYSPKEYKHLWEAEERA